VSGTERSGKTNALKGLAKLPYAAPRDIPETAKTDEKAKKADKERKKGRAIWFDMDNRFLGSEGIRVIKDIGKMENIILELADLAGKIKKMNNSHNQQPIILIIDNFPRFLENMSLEARGGFELMLQDITSDQNIMISVYISGNYSEFLECDGRGDTLFKMLIKNGVTLVTGGKFSQHGYLKPEGLSETEIEVLLPLFCGYYTADGKTEKIKLVYNGG
jgi:hypothetical protein